MSFCHIHVIVLGIAVLQANFGISSITTPGDHVCTAEQDCYFSTPCENKEVVPHCYLGRCSCLEQQKLNEPCFTTRECAPPPQCLNVASCQLPTIVNGRNYNRGNDENVVIGSTGTAAVAADSPSVIDKPADSRLPGEVPPGQPLPQGQGKCITPDVPGTIATNPCSVGSQLPPPPNPIANPDPTKPITNPAPTNPIPNPGPTNPITNPAPINPIPTPDPTNPPTYPGSANPITNPGATNPITNPGATNPTIVYPTTAKPLPPPGSVMLPTTPRRCYSIPNPKYTNVTNTKCTTFRDCTLTCGKNKNPHCKCDVCLCYR